ncbi:hypothetical protein LX36DRAFT_650803 [Colletotrichum falcatum]|nr:hypothetical protein LX36DRAFT_650803 [Colletotrichum falcatum]
MQPVRFVAYHSKTRSKPPSPQPSWRSRWCQVTLIPWGWVTSCRPLNSRPLEHESIGAATPSALQQGARSRPDRPPSSYSPATPRCVFGRPSTSFCASASHTHFLDLLVFSWRPFLAPGQVRGTGWILVDRGDVQVFAPPDARNSGLRKSAA